MVRSIYQADIFLLVSLPVLDVTVLALAIVIMASLAALVLSLMHLLIAVGMHEDVIGLLHQLTRSW